MARYDSNYDFDHLRDDVSQRRQERQARRMLASALRGIEGIQSNIDGQREMWAEHARDTLYPGRTTRKNIINLSDLSKIPRDLVNAVAETFPQMTRNGQQEASDLMARGVALSEETWELERTQNLDGKEAMLEKYRELATDVEQYIAECEKDPFADRDDASNAEA